ncbi:hypothetical protein [Rubritalea tangerina]|uniref:hypothetical protein n=1 Tax=Rubritalea tangerina TaxID=430798 RepID=UPI00360FAA7F
MSEYHNNAKLYPVQGKVPEDAMIVDGYYAMVAEPTGFEEKNLSSCILTIQEKEGGEKHDLLLYEGVSHDITATVGGKIYGFRLHGEIWPTPFQVRFDDSRGEKHPGTGLAMTYESDVTVLDEAGK